FVKRRNQSFEAPRTDKKHNHRAKAQANSRGEVMTGAGRGSGTNVGATGWKPSSANSCVAVARVIGQSGLTSCGVHFSRHPSRMASIFAFGIRCATPPPAG